MKLKEKEGMKEEEERMDGRKRDKNCLIWIHSLDRVVDDEVSIIYSIY